MADDRPQAPATRHPAPGTRHPRPQFPQQDQKHPGRTGPMDPPPDDGEESYRCSGVPTDRKVLPTGAGSGNGRAVAIAFAPEGADLVGRPARPAETAPAYVFLDSGRAGFTTAEILDATDGTPLP